MESSQGRAAEREGGGWSVRASRESHDSINPIRQFEETRFQDILCDANSRKDLEFIKLSIGKPLLSTSPAADVQ